MHPFNHYSMRRSHALFIRRLLLLMCFALVFPCAVVCAQSGPTGSLTGTVLDVNGAAIPGAAVTAKETGTGLTHTITSDEEGNWTIPALPVGVYEVTYEKEGFKRLARQNVAVEASVPRTLDDKLEVGEITGEVVNVTEGTPLLTPETSTTFRQVTSEELVQVPTSTRSFTHLLSTEAGVASDLPPVLTNGNGNISPSVNGTRTTSTSLFFNGVDATNITSNEGSLSDNIAPAPETLSEVKLQTSLYDASTGRSGGGNFQLITKSGTNNYSGTAYYFVQNEKFNANDYFYNRDGIDRPKARRNEGGFTIGGPIVKERFFFFGGYQRAQAVTGFVPTASSITVLPQALSLISGERTAANVVAVFRQLNPAFPLTDQPGQSNSVSPIALALLNQRNPATGDFIVPAPSANARLVGTDRSSRDPAGLAGGNPLVRQRNVFPAEFAQDQFTLKLDGQLSLNNRLSGTFFFSNFPGFDPFPDPSSLASPFTLRRADKNRTLAISDTHVIKSATINEARFGYFSLDNTRRLDDPFLAITNESLGIFNPATFFDASAGTERLGHYIGRNNISRFSFGGPNDSFNQRYQRTFSFADSLTLIRGDHNIRLGGEFKRHQFDTSLPEEQATEFEKIENFTQFLAGFSSEADTQFGITEKSFRSRDLSGFVADDWKVNRKLTLNLGLRYEFFSWPEEVNGRIGNFDFAALSNTGNPVSAFIVPSNVRETGFNAIDATLPTAIRAANRHTLNGQDLNNFAPRFGFAYSPLENNRLVVRGGYGVFFDRPSAAFINTIFSNYPFLREIEVTAPSGRVAFGGLDAQGRNIGGFSQQNPQVPFSGFLPFRVVYNSNRTVQIRDNTPVFRQSNFTANPDDPTQLGTQPIRGNVAETLEFRAIDRDLRTPYIQQWNLGFQYEVAKDLLFEARYVGTKGTKLLQATAFNQPYDLNDANAPDSIFQRFVSAYNASRAGGTALAGELPTTGSARERGLGRAFGFANPYLAGLAPTCVANGAGGFAINIPAGSPTDNNLSTPLSCSSTGAVTGGNVIPFEARGVILGFNIPEAVLLQSTANSVYNALQLNLTKRFSRGLQFSTAYTWSKSIDNNSSDPGSTAGGGKPDIPNTGFVVQGNQRDLSSNRAVSDFDRTHRMSLSFVYDLPTFGSASRFVRGWQLSGFAQAQSGTPFSIFAGEPEISTAAQYADRTAGSGGIYRLGFGRPNLCGSLDEPRRQGDDPTEAYFNTSVLCSPRGGFGNLGRNVLRGPSQKRFDLGLSKTTSITETVGLEFRWDVFNVFNNVNFANPNNDLQDGIDLGTISNTVGGPRVMQFGVKLKF